MKKKTAISAPTWKTAHLRGSSQTLKESYRSLQTSSKTHKTKKGTTSTILFQGFKLETPRLNNQNAQITTIKQQDDWQRQVETINIQLKQLTTEPDYTLQTVTHSDNNELPQESYYELMKDAPDKYFSDNIQTSPVPTDKPPEIHQPSSFSCNEQKQPLLDDDISNHIQFGQERNLSYLPMSTSLTRNGNATCIICQWTSKNSYLMDSSTQEP